MGLFQTTIEQVNELRVRVSRTGNAIPPERKRHVAWWFWNDDDPVPPPGFNKLTWWLRNPFHNFMFYVIGVADRDYELSGNRAPVFGGPFDGWKWTLIHTPVPLPFFAYQSARITLYFGWRTFGAFGAKFNIHKG